MRFKTISFILGLILCRSLAAGQGPCFGLTAIAGPDMVYISSPVTIGGVCSFGGTPPFTNLWLPGSMTTCATSVSPGSTTCYTLIVTDANGCHATDEVIVLNHSATLFYIVPKRNLDAGYQVAQNNKIYFMYEEEYKAGTLQYRILDYDPSTPNIQVPSWGCGANTSVKDLGDNRYYIDLSTFCGSLVSPRFYVVEVSNDKQEKVYFKFLN